MYRIIIILIVAVLVAGAVESAFAQEPPDGPCCPDDESFTVEYILFAPGFLLTGVNLVLVAHNYTRLSSGEPSGRGGGAGILLGSLGTAYGALLVGYAEEDALKFTGMGCAAAGAFSLYYGIKNTRASNRKYDEEHGMVVDPVLINDGSGKLVPGMQVSFSF